MAYQAEISRNNPTAILFVVDQSGSMINPLSNGKTKAQQVADVLNRTLMTLITRCTKSEGTRDYFEVGVIGYNTHHICSGLVSLNSSQIFHPISEIEANPLRVEDRYRKMDDGCGGIIEQSFKFPVWFDAEAEGATPMQQTLKAAGSVLLEWCDKHPKAYPPTIMHITDGASTDGNPEQVAEALRGIATEDGNALLFNLHVSSEGSTPIQFPNSEESLPDDYARMLFRMSSVLPESLLDLAREKGFTVDTASRGFMYNAEVIQIVDFFDIGTRALQLQVR